MNEKFKSVVKFIDNLIIYKLFKDKLNPSLILKVKGTQSADAHVQ